jgi:LmbE family N-acetylglucosaminyl deacetylase
MSPIAATARPYSTSARRVAAALLAALVLGSAATSAPADPRPRDPMPPGDLEVALQKLQVLGSVLYVAAHPDDENTAMLSWLARGRKVRAGYLSLTRGDGGQNLIGDEFGAELGAIRTQELLAARRVDGAEQFFARAVDFGYSKSAEETFSIWGRDSILSDAVWVIRRFQPDVIVTRFPSEGGGGHGHHTASAILAEEAFVAAADPARFPEQLARGVRPWRAKRVMWNAFVQDPSRVDSTWLRVDLGAYEPLLGRAWSEIAAVSRTNHKSQGFGSAERRGSLLNYLAHRAGDRASADLLDGVDLTWRRIPGGEAVRAPIARAERELDPHRPEAIAPRLLEALGALDRLLAAAPGAGTASARPLLEVKRAELLDALRSSLGLWLEAVALEPSTTPGGSVRVSALALNRSNVPVELVRVRLSSGAEAARPRVLEFNRASAETLVASLAGAEPTQAWWLREPAAKGLFRAADPTRVGQAENDAAVRATFTLRVGGRDVHFTLPVSYRWTDPVHGERWRALEVAPPATVKLEPAVVVFPDPSPRTITVAVQAQKDGISGPVRLVLPPGWSCDPPSADVTLAKKGDERRVSFRLVPGETAASVPIGASITVDGRAWAQSLVRIDYPHIPVQTLYPAAEARLVRADIRRVPGAVGYVMGSGDPVPDALRQMGFAVTLLSDDELETGDVSGYAAIVTGVRAYNTRPRLRAVQPRLLDWVNAGGTLIVQYNTADAGLPELGPFPMKLSRERVTVEEAEVTFSRPAHPLLAVPNRIGPADFEGWVQERGLYFASPFDPRYEPLLSSHDPGEPAREGGLLAAKHGRGTFVYCGYAMFRQLPAGVPGAYRLFANLLSARP